MEFSQGYVTTPDGIRLFYQKTGAGPETVLIPNATCMLDDFKWLAENHTVVAYDLRNRGRSDSVTDIGKLKSGIHHDVEDMETIRSRFGDPSMHLIGHSYVGLAVALYAMRYPSRVKRAVMIGSVQPDPRKEYPPHLTGADETLADISMKLAELQRTDPGADSAELGRKMWSLMRTLYVADPSDADKIKWSVAHLPNESLFNVMRHYNDNLLPSIQALDLTGEDFQRMSMPVLIIHGRRDRHAPYGGARDWAFRLPQAQLVTIENAAHLPWIEAPEAVFGSVRTFLDGAWPGIAERVTSD